MKRLISAGSLALSLLMAVVATLPAYASTMYYTNWSHGTAGWQSGGQGGSWQTLGHQLLFSSSTDSTDEQIVAPVNISHTPSFDVIARMKYGGNSSYNGGECFGLVMRTWPGNQPMWWDDSGVYAAVCANSTDSNGAGLGYQAHGSCWAVACVDFIHGSTYNINHGWHTFHVKVRGTSYVFFIDGQRMASVSSNAFLSAPSVGIFTQQSSLTVSYFEITKP